MKRFGIFMAVVTGLVVMAGCGESEPRADAEPVFDPLVDTLDKARETQDLEQERKRRIDEALER